MTIEDKTRLAPTHFSITPPEFDQTRIETPTAMSATPSASAPEAYPNSAFTQQAPAQLQIGDTLKNRFQIIDKLGEGGMGMVFKAVDVRKVEAKSRNPYTAIKVLNPALARNEILVAGLQRECEKAQQLSHPNIITVFDFDRDGDHVFMSMEYLTGKPLNQIIREAAPAGGIKLQRAWPIIRQMGKALAYAHRKNIVHSDFKPGNVYVTEANEVKVLDFGIAAKTDHGNDPDATVFNARAEGGLTPPYASFEMLNGAKADPRDDIYAFGLVVYEMLTGKHPYDRKPASNVFIDQQKGGGKNLPQPKDLSRRQWQLLKSAIELLQDKRPKNLDDWIDQFDPKSNIWTPQWIAVMAAGLVVLGFGINFLLQNQSDSKSSAPTIDTSTQTVTTPDKSAQTPSQPVYNPPIAQAGGDQQSQIGQTVILNGSASLSGDGQPIAYNWRLLQTPFGSQAQLQQSSSINPSLTPDTAGDYLVELTVRDGHNSSAPTTTRIAVAEAVKPALSHQATSDDGILSLAATKPQYRIGEQLKLSLRVTQAGYLRVVYVGAAGEVSEIFPNQQQNSKVSADSDIQIPPKGAKFNLEITGPVGNDKIVALYSQSPIANLENVVDTNGDMASEYLQNNSKAVIQYAVLKK